MNVFTYGTLCIPEVMTAVCGRRPDAIPAQLPGYANTIVQDQCFPGIQPEASSEAIGLLYLEVTPQELVALDEFESDFYDRETLKVNTAIGLVEANVYVVNQAQRDLLTDQVWDEGFFIQHHLATYL